MEEPAYDLENDRRDSIEKRPGDDKNHQLRPWKTAYLHTRACTVVYGHLRGVVVAAAAACARTPDARRLCVAF